MEQSEVSLPKLLKSTEGYNTVVYNNVHIYHKDFPNKKIIDKIKSLTIKPYTIVLLPSPVLFYGIEELKKKIPDTSFIIYIEYDEKLFHIKNNDVCGLLLPEDKRKYFNIKDPGFFNDINKIIPSSINFRDVILLPLNRGYYLNREFYINCLQTAKNSLKLLYKNRLTTLALGQRWYKNIFLNIPAYINSFDINELKVIKPVVVAGAGESLENAIGILKQYRDYFVLVAIDTALNTLLNYEIMPDYILAMESQLYNIFDFHSFKDSEIPVIADITSYPQTSRIFKGKKYFFTSHFINSVFLERFKKLLMIPSFIPPLGSVGVTAVYIASIITKYPVFYCGLDFCYIPGKTHAKNSPVIINHLLNLSKISCNYNYSMSFVYDLKPVIDNAGLKSFTNIILESYAKSLSEISSLKKNIYALLSSGIAVNNNTAADEDDFYSIIRQSMSDNNNFNFQETKVEIETSAEVSTSNEPLKKPGIQAAESAFNQELSGLNKIIEYGVSFLNNEKTLITKQDFSNLILKHDYLYPEYKQDNDIVLTNPAIVKNILLSCYKFSKTIKTAGKIIHHLS